MRLVVGKSVYHFLGEGLVFLARGHVEGTARNPAGVREASPSECGAAGISRLPMVCGSSALESSIAFSNGG
ncbi:MAG: hypothetical protein WAO35_06820 [Terriglobia bacterium]